MRTTTRIITTVAAVALIAPGGIFLASHAEAQLARASAAPLGQGGTGTATVRDFAAMGLNPAGLGMSGSNFTLALAPLRIRQGLDPLTLADAVDFEGTVVPSATKDDWLSQVREKGGQTGSFGVRLSGLALSVGNIGFQVSTIVGGDMNLAPDIVEIMLYGNAGRTGDPQDYSFSGSAVDAFAVTTGGVGFGLPLSSEDAEMALGATLKYSVGHVVAVGRDEGGSIQSDPVRVQIQFPMLHTDDDAEGVNNGNGVGLDVGFQMKKERLSFGAAVLNLVNTFEWDAEKLVYRPGTALLEQGNNNTDFDKQAASQAPSALRSAVDDMTFKPTVSVGAAYDVKPDLTVTADIRNRFGDGLNVDPKLHAGVGAEFRGLQVLHLRAGGAVITDGVQLGGGASLILGPVNLSGAMAIRRGDVGDATIGQFTLSFGGR